MNGSYHVRPSSSFLQDTLSSVPDLEVAIWRIKYAMNRFQWTPSAKPAPGVKAGQSRSIFAPPPEMDKKWPVFTFCGPADGLSTVKLFPQRFPCENVSSGPPAHGENVRGDSRTNYKVWRGLSPFSGLQKDRKPGETCKNRVISVRK